MSESSSMVPGFWGSGISKSARYYLMRKGIIPTHVGPAESVMPSNSILHTQIGVSAPNTPSKIDLGPSGPVTIEPWVG